MLHYIQLALQGKLKDKLHIKAFSIDGFHRNNGGLGRIQSSPRPPPTIWPKIAGTFQMNYQLSTIDAGSPFLYTNQS